MLYRVMATSGPGRVAKQVAVLRGESEEEVEQEARRVARRYWERCVARGAYRMGAEWWVEPVPVEETTGA